jgi:hypothetical protein
VIITPFTIFIDYKFHQFPNATRTLKNFSSKDSFPNFGFLGFVRVYSSVILKLKSFLLQFGFICILPHHRYFSISLCLSGIIFFVPEKKLPFILYLRQVYWQKVSPYLLI